TLSVTVSIGLGVGYPLTGVIASLLHYRMAFLFAAVFALSVAAVVWRFVPEATRWPEVGGHFDLKGALLLGAGLGGLLLLVAEGSSLGWASPLTIGIGAVTIAAFAGW